MGSSSSTSLKKPSVHEALHYLSNEFKPNEEYYRAGNLIANEVFNILRSQRNDVDRVCIAGSIGKRTAVGNCSDFDLVIFLNYKEPPFKTVLNEIKEMLANNKRLKDYRFLKQTSMYIAFEVCGYKFDLAPAANYKGWFSNQHDGTLNKIKGLANPIRDGYMFSPGLAETAVEGVRNQSAFVHAVIRLAKYWNATIVTESHIRGRSLMIEMLAINACWKAEENNPGNLYLSFKQFLTDIQNLDKQRIFNPNSQIPNSILEYRGPLILDPSNCFNNLGHHRNISQDTVEFFQSSAKDSLRALNLWMKDPDETVEGLRSSIFEEPDEPYYESDDFFFNPGRPWS